jgi:hypothetical protein
VLEKGSKVGAHFDEWLLIIVPKTDEAPQKRLCNLLDDLRNEGTGVKGLAARLDLFQDGEEDFGRETVEHGGGGRGSSRGLPVDVRVWSASPAIIRVRGNALEVFKLAREMRARESE